MNEFDNIPMVPQPRNLQINLFNHQLSSIYQMEKLERERIVDSDNGFKQISLGIYADPIGYGKCLALDTDIIMYDGTIKKVQNVRVGDLIMGDDSTAREVLSLARGIDEMYLIKQHIGGVDYTVNKDHILCLALINPKKIYIEQGLYKVRFFVSELLVFSTKTFNSKEIAYSFYDKLDIASTINITVIDYLKLPEDIKQELYGYRVAVEFPRQYIPQDPYEVGFSQRIAPEYVINTRFIRTKLLSGLLDSLSMASANTWYVIDKSLKNTLVFLSRSLGLCVQYNTGSRLHITGNFTDIITRNHSIITTYEPNYTQIEVIPQGEGDYYGFSISGNRRFLLGDFTVTHNTLAIVGLLTRNSMGWNMEMPFSKETIHSESNGLIIKHIVKRFRRLPTTLVLVSSSIVSQWLTELSYSNLNVATVTTRKDVDTVKAENFDVIIIVPTMYNDYMRSYSNFAWKRFIFDEPNSVRIPRMKDIVAGFYWFVTATPNDMKSMYQHARYGFMRNIVGDMWNNSIEEQYKEVIIKNDLDFVKKSFLMPPVNHIYHKCYETLIHALRGVVDDQVMDLLNAGNIEEAITALGGYKVTNVIELVKQKKNDHINQLNSLKTSGQICEHEIAKIEEKITTLQRQIETIDSRYEEILNNNNCNICLDNLKHPVMEPNCQNIFCTDCIIRWLSKVPTCPLCKCVVNKQSLLYIKTDNDLSPVNNHVQMTTKTQKILELIQSNAESKFLIMSRYYDTFVPICRLLTENNIPFVQVKGSQHVKEKKINAFKTGNIRVIFLESLYDSSGINLQEASDIIFYHRISKDMEEQIVGRVMRIGQTKPLNVHHLQA